MYYSRINKKNRFDQLNNYINTLLNEQPNINLKALSSLWSIVNLGKPKMASNFENIMYLYINILHKYPF